MTEGLTKIPNIPVKYRKSIRNLHAKLGTKKFYSKLIKLDPHVKNKINMFDSQRAIRAFEVKSFTKKSLYDWFKNTKADFEKKDFYKIYIEFPRAELVKRINMRAEYMVKNGAISEVKKFVNLKIPKNNTASKAIGIEEIRRYLSRKIQISELIEKNINKDKTICQKAGHLGQRCNGRME